MSFLLDLTVEHRHNVPPARRTAGAGNIKWTDEMLAFGESNNGTTFEKTFRAYQKSFVPQGKEGKAGAVAE